MVIRELAAFRAGVSAADKFLETVWSLLTKRSWCPWGRCCLLAHCCQSFSSSVSCCVWRCEICLRKGGARGSGLGGSWAKWAADLSLWEERAFSCLFTSACWASNLAPNVLHTETGGCSETFPSPTAVWWDLGDPAQPAVVSHFCMSYGSREMNSHAPAACHLTPLGMLALGDGRHLGWRCSGAKLACLKCVV